MPSDSSSDAPARSSGPSSRPAWRGRLLRGVLWVGGLSLAGLLSLFTIVGVALAVAYPNLPDISDLSDYRPKLPLRVFSADGLLMGEFGEERRNLTPIREIPKVMVDAVLAIEDARFYSHGGVDYKGLLRAALANLGRVKSQGASTITMQVARNVYLSSEKTFTRKLYEVLLTFKLEHMLSKDQILEIYMNQIFLGNRAYGFAAASEAYFGKPMKDLTIAEAAMLAGLPKAPSAYNPIINPSRARTRQQYIIDRMQENGFITAAEAEVARKQELHVRTGGDNTKVHAEYIAETVRQMVYAQYGDETYTRGLNVFTTVKADEQDAAYKALRKGIMDYERRQIYRGPEEFIELPANPKEAEDAIDDALADHPDNGDVLAAVQPEGTLTGCSFTGRAEANALEPGAMAEAWPRAFGEFRDFVSQAPEPCASCEYLRLCRGGCRAVAQAHGPFFAPDPGCPRVQEYRLGTGADQGSASAGALPAASRRSLRVLA